MSAKERKTKIEPQIKSNHSIYKQMKHITVLPLLKLKMTFKQRAYFLLQVYVSGGSLRAGHWAN